MGKQNKLEELWTVEVLLVVTLLDAVGVGFILPHIQTLSRPPGTGWGFAAGIGSLYAGFQLIGGPMFGVLADSGRLSRKKALQIATAGAAAAYGALVMWPGLGGVIISRVLAGLLKHGGPVVQAAVADITRSHNGNGHTVRTIGRIAVAKSIGNVIGPAIGGYFEPIIAGVAAVMVFAISFGLISVCYEEPSACLKTGSGRRESKVAHGGATFVDTSRTSWLGAIASPEIAVMIGLWGLMATGLSLFRGALRPLMEIGGGVTDRVMIGWFQSGLHLAEVGTQLGIERHAASFEGHEARMLELACWAAAVSVSGAALLAKSPVAVLAVLLPFYASTGVARVCFAALLSSRAHANPGTGLAALHGVVQSIMTATRLLGPMVAGVMIDQSGLAVAPQWLAACLFVVAATVATHALRNDKTKEE